MISLIDEEDFNKAVCILEKSVSSQLLRKILIADCGKDFYDSLDVNHKMQKRELCELLIEERGTELFSNSKSKGETYELKETLLSSVPDELIMDLYQRYPEKGRKITSVSYMRRPLAEKRWVSGKSYARAYIEAVGFPEIFAGIGGDEKTKKQVYEDIMPKMPERKLKEYQLEMKEKMLKILNGEGENRNCMLSLPTGGGKTRIAVEAFLEWMQRKFDENKYLIWIAQSEELCEQCISCIEEVWGKKEFVLSLRVYRYFAGYNPKEEDLQGGVIVCSIQKIHSQLKTEEKTKIQEILSHTGAVIIDEAHRASTMMYDEFLDMLQDVNERKHVAICGLSATPGRTKVEEEGKKLVERFETNLITPEFKDEDSIYKEHPLQYFKDKGYLSRTRHVLIKGEIVYHLSDVELREIKADDCVEYTKEFLKHIAKDEENNRRILHELTKIPEGKAVLVYTCTVEQAKHFALYMTHRGYRAAAIASDTPVNVRRRQIAEFKKGSVQFLFNYGVLTTGFDAPKVEYIVLARPVRSEILYEQIIGRGIRGAEFGGTELCTIIDFYDNSIIQGEPLSFERFRNYWDMDAEGNPLHCDENKICHKENAQVFIVERVKRCPLCHNSLTNSQLTYEKNGKSKKLLARYCKECGKYYVTEKFYHSLGFPIENFTVNIVK